MAKNSKKILITLIIVFFVLLTGTITCLFLAFSAISNNNFSFSFSQSSGIPDKNFSISKDFTNLKMADSPAHKFDFGNIDIFGPEFFKTEHDYLLRKMDEEFGNLRNRMKYFSGSFSNPSIKTTENQDEYIISVNLNSFGGSEENINIDVKGRRVVISGKYKDENSESKSYKSSSFYQSLTLSQKVDASKIKTQRKENILTFIIPKVSNKKVDDKYKDKSPEYVEFEKLKDNFI